MLKLLCCASRNLLISQRATSVTSKRTFFGWLNFICNGVNTDRIKEVGPDQAAAEWLIRCGASVRWAGADKFHSDYNTLPAVASHSDTGPGTIPKYRIEEIDATDSCIMDVGFVHLKGLKYVKRIKLHRCNSISDNALDALIKVKDSLNGLQVSSCASVTIKGLLNLQNLKNLSTLKMFDLQGIQNREEVVAQLRSALPNCDITFPSTI